MVESTQLRTLEDQVGGRRSKDHACAEFHRGVAAAECTTAVHSVLFLECRFVWLCFVAPDDHLGGSGKGHRDRGSTERSSVSAGNYSYATCRACFRSHS